MARISSILLGLAALAGAVPGAALSADVPADLPTDGSLPTIDPSLIPEIDIGSILPEDVMRMFLKTMAILTNHRPFQPATSLGWIGFEVGIEASLVHLPDDFASSLSGLGMSGGATAQLPSLPMAKLHVHKGLGERFEIGASGIYYPGIQILGGDVKYVVYKPDEGLTWAARIGYAQNVLDFGSLGLGQLPIQVEGIDLGTASLTIKTHTITPQIVASKKMLFADPYIGLGYTWTTGQIELPIKLNVLEETQYLRSPSYRSNGGIGFLGVGFRLIPVKIAMEMGYSTMGMHYFGVTLGVCI